MLIAIDRAWLVERARFFAHIHLPSAFSMCVIFPPCLLTLVVSCGRESSIVKQGRMLSPAVGWVYVEHAHQVCRWCKKLLVLCFTLLLLYLVEKPPTLELPRNIREQLDTTTAVEPDGVAVHTRSLSSPEPRIRIHLSRKAEMPLRYAKSAT